jgi:hypothetical protein
MGCFRIVTSACIEQLRATHDQSIATPEIIEQLRKVQNDLASAALGVMVPDASLIHGTFKLIRNATATLQQAIADATEIIAQSSLGEEGGHNLNSIEKNFRIYDVSNHNHVASVKGYGLAEDRLSSQTRSNYLRDIRVAVGLAVGLKDVNKFEAAAESLRRAAIESSLPLPSALQEAKTTAAACDWLCKNAEIRIPNDHVESVRKSVERAVKLRPEVYGLPPDAPFAERIDFGKQLAERVQPMGHSTAEILQLMDQVIQKSFY